MNAVGRTIYIDGLRPHFRNQSACLGSRVVVLRVVGFMSKVLGRAVDEFNRYLSLLNFNELLGRYSVGNIGWFG